jgi:adenosylcobalamin-dependent ribonucleoside-triphosphate reductase
MSTNNVFRLSRSFVKAFETVKPPFGFNGLGELVYQRTYSRKDLVTGKKERWIDTIERVVNGCYTMQKRWITESNLGWSDESAQDSAQEMFTRMYHMKFLPPGRGLWCMGTSVTEERGLYAALNNCAFVSTKDMDRDPCTPFLFLFDYSMLGVGVGFDTEGAGKVKIHAPNPDETHTIVIEDTREGWVNSMRHLLSSYFYPNKSVVQFDYSKIRPAGLPIKTFGGVSSGPEPLQKLLEKVRDILNNNVGNLITDRIIADIQNLIGTCVVAGNVRRTAEIILGNPYSEEFLNLKNYDLHPERIGHGWTSNNSVKAELGMDYTRCAQLTKLNGEPGYFWLDNARDFSRMNNVKDHRDHRATGTNPCCEQTLESFEMCNLVEVFLCNHESEEDFNRTLKFAYLYAKSVTLGNSHWPETNRVMLRNKRIGCSLTGITQFISRHGINQLKNWCQSGYNTIQKYDDIYSDWLAIPRSIKTTTIKPSGSVSLLAGATPGMHWPESKYYIRRVRLSVHSEMIEPLKNSGYKVEPCAIQPSTTVVVEIPVYVGEMRTVNDVSMWEQLELAAFLQEYWSDNQVSATVTFKPESEGDQIAHALNYYQYRMKGVSFLPKAPVDKYPQLPYEEITKEQYEESIKGIKELNFDNNTGEDAEETKFCDGDKCML